jgi:hypothetical protein
MPHLKRLSGYFLSFAGWSAVFALLYHLGADFYANMLVIIAEMLTNNVLPVSMQTHPNGFVVFSPEARGPMGVPYRLYLIGLNVIFAPALVLTTFGVSTTGAVRALIAILIVILLQAIQVVFIVLFSASHPDNALFSLDYSDFTVAAIAWTSTFMDRMGYALFPFLAWAIVSSDLIRRRPDASPTRSDASEPTNASNAGAD